MCRQFQRWAGSNGPEGAFRITVRETRFNSQRYPLVTSTLQPESFKTATAARAYAKEHLGAENGQFASA